MRQRFCSACIAALVPGHLPHDPVPSYIAKYRNPHLSVITSGGKYHLLGTFRCVEQDLVRSGSRIKGVVIHSPRTLDLHYMRLYEVTLGFVEV